MNSERIYRLLLHLYPGEFRREYGEEMALCFRDSLRAEAGTAAFARLWLETLFDLISSVLRENWQSLHRLMSPKNQPKSRLVRFVTLFPFGSAFLLVALVAVIGLGLQLRTKDFTSAAYLLVMMQVTVLSLIILVSGFIVDVEHRCLRLLRRQVTVSSLIGSTIGILLMGIGIYHLQYLDMTVEQLIPLVLQIVTCGTLWMQVVMLNEIRLLQRDLRAE